MLIVSTGSAAAQEDIIKDVDSGISIRIPEGWEATNGSEAASYVLNMPNPNLVPMGANLRKDGILLLKINEMQDLVPNVQFAVHEGSGLKIDPENIEFIEQEIERIYSERSGSRFRLFLIEERWINGLRAILIEGVYVWRTNNIKIKQYLIPGSNKFYSLTYTCKEMEFAKHFAEVEEVIKTASIPDRPLELDWLWNFLKFVVLVGAVAAILWGMFFANSITPNSRKTGFSVFRFLKSDASSKENPFMKK